MGENPHAALGRAPLQQAVVVGVSGGGRPVRHAQLGEDVAQVALDGSLADRQLARDLAVGASDSHQAEHLELPVGDHPGAPRRSRRLGRAGCSSASSRPSCASAGAAPSCSNTSRARSHSERRPGRDRRAAGRRSPAAPAPGQPRTARPAPATRRARPAVGRAPAWGRRRPAGVWRGSGWRSLPASSYPRPRPARRVRRLRLGHRPGARPPT